MQGGAMLVIREERECYSRANEGAGLAIYHI